MGTSGSLKLNILLVVIVCKLVNKFYDCKSILLLVFCADFRTTETIIDVTSAAVSPAPDVVLIYFLPTYFYAITAPLLVAMVVLMLLVMRYLKAGI